MKINDNPEKRVNQREQKNQSQNPNENSNTINIKRKRKDSEVTFKNLETPYSEINPKLTKKPKRLKKFSSASKTKKIKKKKETILHNSQIKKLKQCNSKIQLRRIILKLTPDWKKIIKFYMTECFIHDLYTRRLENKMFLLSKRELLYKLIDNPELLTLDCHFDNNLLKNYCTGIANFVVKHHKDIKQILQIQI